MSMTDPIADFLTRIRNAIQRRARDRRDPGVASSSARWPASSRSRATSTATRSRRRPPSARASCIRVQLKYTDDRRSAISGLRRVSRPGSATTSHAGEHPEGPGRHGHDDRVHVARRDDRPRGPPGGRRRRGRGGGLVAAMSPHRHASPSPCPPASPSRSSPSVVRVQRPARASSPSASTATSPSRRRTTQLIVTRPTDRGEHRALHGLTRSLVANMVEGVTNGYAEDARDPGRRLPRRSSRARTSSWRSATRTRSRSRRPTASSSRCPQPTRVDRQGHLQAARRRDRRQHPQAAAAGALQGQGHPLRGRVRRPEGRQARMTVLTKPAAPPQAPPPRAREGRRHRRAPAHLRVPLQPRHLRPAHRRRRRPHARRGRLDRGRRCATLKPHGAGRRKAGELLAERAKAAGVERAVFDRGGYQYHGRVKAFAEGVREGGLAV